MIATSDKRMSYTDAWRAKHVFIDLNNRPWSYMFDNGRVIVTAWERLIGAGDLTPDMLVHDGKAVFQTYEKDHWPKYPKGIKYMRHAQQCMAEGRPAEVILLTGHRDFDGRDHVMPNTGARISEDFYFLKFTHVNDKTGLVLGEFLTRDEGNR